MSEEMTVLPLLAVMLRDAGWRCDEEDASHGARRRAPDGVLNGTRWKATDALEPTHLTLYEVTSGVALCKDEDSGGGIVLNLSDGEGPIQLYKPLLSSTQPSTTPEQPPFKHLLAVWVSVQAGKESEFVDWYEREHMPMLEKVPGWLCGRLYTIMEDISRSEDAQEHLFLAVHQFSKGGFMETEELKASQNTPWLTKVMEYITSKELRLFELDALYDSFS